MKRPTATALAALMIGLAAALPARAEEGVKDMALKTAWFPVQVAGVGAGLLVGVPWAVTRQVITRSVQKTGDIADNIGGKEHFPPNIFAAPIGFAWGTVVGTGEGVYWGGRNAFKYGVEKPFSVSSFSLKDDLEG